MRKWVNTLAGAAAVLVAAGCEGPLDVENPNNPDIERAFSTAGSIEQVIGSAYQSVFRAIHGSNTAVKPQLMNMAFESNASVANNGMALRAALPRLPVLNGRGNTTANEVFRDFTQLQQAARNAADAIIALDKLTGPERGGTLGSPGRNARGRAFAFFADGVALGFVALVYDSASIVTPAVVAALPAETFPPLSSAQDVMGAALDMLDTAIAIAQAAPSGGFPLPAEWIRGSALTQAEFIRLARSYKARFRAGVARTPEQRAAADWNAIIADAENGITADFNINIDAAAGWANAWIGQHHIFLGWHQMPLFIIGMADVSGAYDAWLARPIGQRGPFVIVTPDLRFPRGSTRPEQVANSPAAPTGVLYFRNRSGGDTPGEPWATSFYDHYRFIGLFNNSNRGPWPEITKAEMDMLAAEGYIRTNRIPQAVPLINQYRTRAGLPALGAITSLTQQVPGGASCVPRVPAAPNFTSTTCGNIMEAMKWEKRMETAFTDYSVWYFDSRGWGDLAENTPLEYPVPYQEMDARARPFYNLGGGGPSSAAKGTYGF